MSYYSSFPDGTIVKVTEAYIGAGNYRPDGNEGIYTVVGYLGAGDYYLVKGDRRSALPPREDWDLISHETRLDAV